MSTSHAEAELIHRARTGDADAFKSLYEQHVALVYAFLRRRVGEHNAEDLTAETFCRAWQNLPQFEWRGLPFRSWLLRIANNLVIAQWRRADSRTTPVADPSREAGAQAAAPPISSHLEGGEVMDALATLNRGYQTVLELRFVRSLSVAETAAALGSSEEAVRAQTYRALKALRAAHSRLVCGSTVQPASGAG